LQTIVSDFSFNIISEVSVDKEDVGNGRIESNVFHFHRRVCAQPFFRETIRLIVLRGKEPLDERN
jgi:hypothetical protein